jgi:UDP-N-acetyl-2-amino-2-deoxyglucuronate dehydrogenase
MGELTFSIIGCGAIAQRHALHIAKRGTLLAVCDIDESKAKKLAEEYGARAFSDAATMLQQCPAQVVAVCTPNGWHARHSIMALQQGSHVVCEKPLAISVADCTAMIAAAAAGKRMLFAIKQNRYNPPVVAVKQLLHENRLGKMLSFQLNCFWSRSSHYYHNNWRGTADMDGGILFTQFSHFIDLVYWLLGDVEQVQGLSANLMHKDTTAFEDTVVLTVLLKSGALGTMHFTTNAYAKNMEGSLTIFGEKGTVKIGGEYLNELTYQNIAGYDMPALPMGPPANNYGSYTGSMSNHDKVYDNVVDVLCNNGNIYTTAQDAATTIAIIEKIHNAIRRT